VKSFPNSFVLVIIYFFAASKPTTELIPFVSIEYNSEDILLGILLISAICLLFIMGGLTALCLRFREASRSGSYILNRDENVNAIDKLAYLRAAHQYEDVPEYYGFMHPIEELNRIPVFMRNRNAFNENV